MGGNQSSVTAVLFSGAAATVLMWLLGFFAPELMATAPTGLETAIGTLITGGLCYLLPAFGAHGSSGDGGGQAGFVRLSVLVSLVFTAIVVLWLAACTALSFDQRLANAYATNTAVRTTAAAAVNAGSMSSADGERVLEITDQARGILDDAADGDERGLSLAIEIISGVEKGVQ
jgi:hypothetical protein